MEVSGLVVLLRHEPARFAIDPKAERQRLADQHILRHIAARVD
jgi:hypothetical protein